MTGGIGRLTKERDDFVEIVNAPTSLIAIRNALTKGLPAAMRLIQARMVQLDGLILQFGHTAAGQKMIEVWKSSRKVRDLGHGPREEEAPTLTVPALAVLPAVTAVEAEAVV